MCGRSHVYVKVLRLRVAFPYIPSFSFTRAKITRQWKSTLTLASNSIGKKYEPRVETSGTGKKKLSRLFRMIRHRRVISRSTHADDIVLIQVRNM